MPFSVLGLFQGIRSLVVSQRSLSYQQYTVQKNWSGWLVTIRYMYLIKFGILIVTLDIHDGVNIIEWSYVD